MTCYRCCRTLGVWVDCVVLPGQNLESDAAPYNSLYGASSERLVSASPPWASAKTPKMDLWPQGTPLMEIWSPLGGRGAQEGHCLCCYIVHQAGSFGLFERPNSTLLIRIEDKTERARMGSKFSDSSYQWQHGGPSSPNYPGSRSNGVPP